MADKSLTKYEEAVSFGDDTTITIPEHKPEATQYGILYKQP